MRYVGLDAHWRQSTICVLDHRGQKLLSRTIKGPWSKVLEEVPGDNYISPWTTPTLPHP